MVALEMVCCLVVNTEMLGFLVLLLVLFEMVLSLIDLLLHQGYTGLLVVLVFIGTFIERSRTSSASYFLADSGPIILFVGYIGFADRAINNLTTFQTYFLHLSLKYLFIVNCA